MKQFMDENFLLDTECAQKLYYDFAAPMPILDYHCHINPMEIATDRQFKNITEAWLAGDHYKWRQMRANGIAEAYITGDASDREKFQAWAKTLEKLIGNPLYHWSHLELKRYFGYDGHLNGETAEEVWQLCNEKLKKPDMRVRGLIAQSNVSLLCTTDDPVDSLKWHKELRKDDGFRTTVLPAWRPDQILNIESDGFLPYIQTLSQVSRISIASFLDLKQAIETRMDYFHAQGCHLSDHGLVSVMYAPATEAEIESIFQKALSRQTLTLAESAKYKTALLLFFGRQYYRRGWTMQLHYGCRRNNNTAMFQKLGADTGFDCIGNDAPADQLIAFLDNLAFTGELPKTILYSLNPNDNALIGTIIGCFQDASIAGKIQHGSAWWFNDHKTGMIAQLTSLANLGILGNFIGMLTDSRSFLSYPRHEYFRRILCNLIGGWVENGEYPYDEAALEAIVKGICYRNAVAYFGFENGI